MRPKARGVTLHGCPPGWLDESAQQGALLIFKAVTVTFHLLPPAAKLFACWNCVDH
jgi:hypothetical protein